MTEGYFDRRWQSWQWDDGAAPDRPADDRGDTRWDDDDRWEAMRRARDQRPQEPAWLTDPTTEWVPLPGQRYPGDQSAGRRPAREPDPPAAASRGRANVYRTDSSQRQSPDQRQLDGYAHRSNDAYRPADPQRPAARGQADWFAGDGQRGGPRPDSSEAPQRRPDDTFHGRRHPDDVFQERRHPDDVFHGRRHPDDVFHERRHPDDVFHHERRHPQDRQRAAPPPDRQPPRRPVEPFDRQRHPDQGQPPTRPDRRAGQWEGQWEGQREAPRDRPPEGYRRDDRQRPQPDQRPESPQRWPAHQADQPPPASRPDPRRPGPAEVYRVKPGDPAAEPVRQPGRPVSGVPGRPTSGIPGRPTSGIPGRPTSGIPGRPTSGAGRSRVPGTDSAPQFGPGSREYREPPAQPTTRPPVARPSVAPLVPASAGPANPPVDAAPRRPTPPDQTGEQLPIPVSAPAGPPPEFRVSTATGEHPQVRPVRKEQGADEPAYVVRARPEPRHAPPPYIVRNPPEREDNAPVVVSRPAPQPTLTGTPGPTDTDQPTVDAGSAIESQSIVPDSDTGVDTAKAIDVEQPRTVDPDALETASHPVDAAVRVPQPPAPTPQPPVPASGQPPVDAADGAAQPAAHAAWTRDPVDLDPSEVDQPEDSASRRIVDRNGQSADDDVPEQSASPDTVLPVVGTAAGTATALGAPTMLAPLVQPDQQTAEPDPPPPAEPKPADPEHVLSAYQWRFHPDTLRELVENPDDLRAIRDRLTEKIAPATDNATRARLLSLRAVVSRILGDLGKALADAKLALAHAEATGEMRRIAIAQARLAHVLQWRGDFAEADRLFEEANSSELPDRLRATMHEHAGRSCYDQGRYMEACNHFERALELRKVEDPDLIARTELALDAVFAKVAENGWGPYPRDRDEILRLHRPPRPTFSDQAQRWGYAGADGELAIGPSYADVQPFHDGVAWVRRPESRFWELIDEAGTTTIAATAGYIAVGSFSDGIAWVTADGTGSWIAIDRKNTVVIGAGFDDVRPFRRGVAVVRRGGWGAVDKTGRLLLPTRYGGFPTALTDGRYIDGFTDEGLAIIDAGGRKGVVDRSGRMIVPPVHPAMAIHPVAFLVATPDGRWGALDRRGQPLIDPAHPSRAAVMDEIDRLLADTMPVL
ncbi:WG repeat-containing protein [Micromonospora sp. NBC_01813]|uniref:WG repeat-containing protein n=1 Tax=Micromonospora sp. NBC_01813 TaxID=2975988 RepID=UPI002DD85E76|nr:WG repeat-containing protein [Micromonospora sp. NBC_01813]WSA09543.1 WG repeat-containing protein [Micromonospora sp. NBC_01813]